MVSEGKGWEKKWCHARDVRVIVPASDLKFSMPASAKETPARLVKFNTQLTERELIADLKRQLQAAQKRIAQLEGK